MKKGITWGWVIFMAVLLTLGASAVYSLVGLLHAPTGAAAGSREPGSDYMLMLGQSLLGIIVMFLPSLVERRLHIAVPGRMYIFYVIFLYAAIFLGEVQRFYVLIPYWDLVLHACSGLMLGAIGFSVVSLLNDADRVRITMSPLFVAVFAFCFALALGVIWEIYEFAMDGVLGLNMQRALGSDGSGLAGRAALEDTMTDLLVDELGGLVMSAAGYVSLKRGMGWINSLSLKRIAPGRAPGPGRGARRRDGRRRGAGRPRGTL